MCQDSVDSDGSSAVPDEAIVKRTESGGLVFMPTGDGKLDLLGFINITDWDELAEELRRRGIDTEAAEDRTRFPEFDK